MYDTIPLLPLAALFDFDHRIINELIPIAGIILAGVITVSAMYFSHHQKKMLHETTRLALERGQPLSPELIATLRNESRCSRGGRNDIRKGLILMAVGAGLILFMSRIADELRFVGAIPGFIGVTLFNYGLLEPMFSRKSRESGDRNAGS